MIATCISFASHGTRARYDQGRGEGGLRAHPHPYAWVSNVVCAWPGSICAWPGSISARLQLPNARLQLRNAWLQLRNVRLHLEIRTCQLARLALALVLGVCAWPGSICAWPGSISARLQLARLALGLARMAGLALDHGARQRDVQLGLPQPFAVLWRRLLCGGRLAGIAILQAMQGVMRPISWLVTPSLAKLYNIGQALIVLQSSLSVAN